MQEKIEMIDANELLTRTLQFSNDGYRLVQICATRYDETFELTYSFDLNSEMKSIRFIIAHDTEIISISHVYSYSFLYENELKDLYGIRIKMISIDYEGNLYRTSIKTPFNTPKGE